MKDTGNIRRYNEMGQQMMGVPGPGTGTVVRAVVPDDDDEDEGARKFDAD